MKKTTLSQEQQSIIDYWLNNQGAMLIEAAAGSGKTRVLTECVRNLLEIPKSKFKVLCLTFTNKAADEMQDRLGNVKGIKDRAFIGTIHGFALEIIKSFKHEIGYSEMPHIIEREADRKEILKDVFFQHSSLNQHFNNPPNNITLEKHQTNFLNNCLEFISEQKRKLVFIPDDLTEYENWDEVQLFMFKEYNQRLKNQNLIDYDDILVLAWLILTERASSTSIYQRLYRYILVDEAQDLNYSQYQLIKAVCGDSIKNVLMVGDGNQSIHGYAGASKKYMLEHFVKDFQIPAEAQKQIKFNYRSSKAVINAANLVIDNSAKNDNSFFEGEVKAYGFNDEEQEAKWVISKIKTLLALRPSDEFEGQITLDEIAVLARNRFVFNELKTLLDNDEYLQGKYYLKKGTDNIEPESTFMKVFELGTRILTNKTGYVYLKQILLILSITDFPKSLSTKGIDILKEIKNYLPTNSLLNQTDFDNLILSWESIENNSVLSCFSNLKLYAKLLTNENEQVLAIYDINDWEAAWSKYIRSVSASSISFADFRRFVAMGINVATHQSELTLATVHAVKGLEFHIVFLVGMGEGTFPDYRSTKGKALEEERNNAYVAVTRAKRRLYVSYPKTKKMPWGDSKQQAPSQFLQKFQFE